MKLTARMILYIPCTHCGEGGENHNPDCPVLLLTKLDAQRKRLGCPVCNKDAVDLNTDDHFECRACRAQFCQIGSFGLEPLDGKELLIIDVPGDCFHKVYRAKVDGAGHIPIDEAIAELEGRMSKKKKRKK